MNSTISTIGTIKNNRLISSDVINKMSLSISPMNPSSEGYITTQYQLQQQLKAPRLKILEIFDVNNVQQAINFGKFCENLQPLNVVHVFIPTSSLRQPITDIAQRGIRVHREGVVVQPDHINVDKSKDVIEVVHALVALGNVYNFQPIVGENLEDNTYITKIPTPEDLPPEYDSLRISEDGQFVIFKQDQIRTLHIVRFTGGKDLEVRPESEDICIQCHDRATCYCINCDAKLCDECYNKTHSSSALMRGHKSLPIDTARTLMEECPFHPGHKVEHFCFQCQLPVCLECKMSGTHSIGAASKHALVPLKDAYLAALKHTETEDRIYARRRRALKEKQNEVNKRLQDVIENEKTVEARIMKVAQEAILSLKEQSGERALRIRSTLDEIDRKLQEIEEKSSFVSVHREYSDPVTFIKSSCIHDRILTELKHDDDFPLDCAIEGDLCLTGGLQVMPRQVANIPEGLKVHDIPFDERARITDVPETTTTIPPTTETATTDSRERTVDFSKVKVTKMSAVAARKRGKLARSGMKLTFKPFKGSHIIDLEMGERLYLCCPFKSTPQTHLLFSTRRDGRSLHTLHEMVDGLGITAVIVKKGDFVFGGFAGSKWNSNGEPFGDGKSTFIFSITRDAIIPYRPTIEDPAVLFAERDTLTFGKYDLVLGGNFDSCVAVIENSFSIGIGPDTPEAEEFLCGQPEFKADEVEVWGFFSDTK